MPLSAGTKLGPYEIVSPLGAGGMGEVYRALDPRLERTVAIKILPAHLSSNPEAKERFEREAKCISALQHGNICSLYDVGSQNGVSYLVMEYLEGETLADRLRKGPLPLEQVLRHGAEICEGLERAHKIGVVHRDLKPGNIMLTKSGAKLMDFGLAKPVSVPSVASSELTQTMSTPSHPLTAQGTIIGTFQYMSPEQIEGKESDSRSDIFSLGTVLYEMATGKRAFEGKSMVSIAAAILEKEPEPIGAVQPLSPASLQHVIEGCMAKDPEARWQSAGDVGRQLRWIGSAGSKTGVPAATAMHAGNKVRERGIWAAVVLLCLIAAAWGLLSRMRSPLLMANIVPASGTTYEFMGDFSGPPVLSPDGSRLAYVARTTKEGPSIWVRRLDSAAAQQLAGTTNASNPFWSADGRNIGFFADGRLKKISPDGGPTTVLAEATNPRGGTWNSDNVIVYSPDYREGLWRTTGDGGTPTRATKIDPAKHTTHRWPVFLPDGKHFIFFATNHAGGEAHENGTYLATLGDETSKLVLAADSAAAYSRGYLLFHQQNAVMAQKMDPSTGALSGEQTLVANAVQFDAGTWHTTFTVAENGVLIYQPGLSTTESSTLTWKDRDGKSVGSIADAEAYRGMRISPDGKRVAVTVGDPTPFIWVYDTSQNNRQRLTFDAETHLMPAWSPDGRSVLYTSQSGSSFTSGSTVHIKSASGSGQDELLVGWAAGSAERNMLWPELSLPVNGTQYVVYEKVSGPTGGSIWAMELLGERKQTEIVKPDTSQGTIGSHRLSHDSRWLAYSARDSGRQDVYITSFPSGKGRWQISTEGGTFPVWRGDDKEIYFLGLDGVLRAVELTIKGDDLEIGPSQTLFTLRNPNPNPWFAPFDVAADGKRFIVLDPTSTITEPMVVVSDWTALLKK